MRPVFSTTILLHSEGFNRCTITYRGGLTAARCDSGKVFWSEVCDDWCVIAALKPGFIIEAIVWVEGF